MNGEQLILEKLEEIKKDVQEIKEHMIDVDAILDQEDLKAIDEAENDLKEGRTITLWQLKKELGL
ncbi:MAG: hypothetical protein AABW64_01450 [Nanoarchaeota archaeon]